MTSVSPNYVPWGRKVIIALLLHNLNITEACAGQPVYTYMPLIQRCRQPKQRRMPMEIVQGGRRGTWKGSESTLGGVRDDTEGKS